MPARRTHSARMASDRTDGPKPRLIVGITGASGVIYGVRLLELLQGSGIETHLIMSRAAHTTLAYETTLKVADVEKLATVVHPNSDIGAACSSGSFKTLGNDRCAVLDQDHGGNRHRRYGQPHFPIGGRGAEGTPPRGPAVEGDAAPYWTYSQHGRGDRGRRYRLSAGAAFYSKPKSLAEMIDHTLGRVLDLFDIDTGTVNRWTGDKVRPKPPTE